MICAQFELRAIALRPEVCPEVEYANRNRKISCALGRIALRLALTQCVHSSAYYAISFISSSEWALACSKTDHSDSELKIAVLECINLHSLKGTRIRRGFPYASTGATRVRARKCTAFKRNFYHIW